MLWTLYPARGAAPRGSTTGNSPDDRLGRTIVLDWVVAND